MEQTNFALAMFKVWIVISIAFSFFAILFSILIAGLISFWFWSWMDPEFFFLMTRIIVGFGILGSSIFVFTPDARDVIKDMQNRKWNEF